MTSGLYQLSSKQLLRGVGAEVMAPSSISYQRIITFPSFPPVNVLKQSCSLGLQTRSSCHGILIEHSRPTTAGSRRRIQISASSSAGKGSASVLDKGILPTEDSPTAVQDNEYIGYGRLLADRTFRERFVIRFSEVSTTGKISSETLSSLLQEAATNHVLEMDYGFSPGKNMNGNITVTTRMHIEVDRYPEWRDLIEIDTWFQPEGKNSVRRDWIVKDVRTGENIAFATSTWVLMNTETRRLCKMTEELWQELHPHMMGSPPKWALSEERRKESSKKIVKLGGDAAFKIESVVATEQDCDMNQHVNNVKYIGWMIETVPEEIKRSHEVIKITIEYRQEANQGECVDTVANIENLENSDVKCFTHLTLKTGDGKEVNRGGLAIDSLASHAEITIGNLIQLRLAKHGICLRPYVSDMESSWTNGHLLEDPSATSLSNRLFVPGYNGRNVTVEFRSSMFPGEPKARKDGDEMGLDTVMSYMDVVQPGLH